MFAYVYRLCHTTRLSMPGNLRRTELMTRTYRIPSLSVLLVSKIFLSIGTPH